MIDIPRLSHDIVGREVKKNLVSVKAKSNDLVRSAQYIIKTENVTNSIIIVRLLIVQSNKLVLAQLFPGNALCFLNACYK